MLPSGVHHGDSTIAAITRDRTGFYQMLGISCHGLCPVALLETQCAGLQVLMSCQKGRRRVLRKGMVTNSGTTGVAFLTDHIFGFKGITVKPKGSICLVNRPDRVNI